MRRLRRARAADGGGLHAVHTAAVRVTCRGHYADDEIDAWAARLAPASHADDVARRDVIVCEDDGRLVGFAVLDPDLGELRACYVHPAAGRSGVGAALLAALECTARLRGLAALHLDASLNAVAFYARAGWRAEGPTTRTIAPGRDIACVAMTKALAPLRVVVRDETAADADAIRALHAARAAASPSLVATIDGRVAGHVAFAAITAAGRATRELIALAVTPELRECGLGSRLVEEGLARCREAGAAAVVARGCCDFLARFGFDPADDGMVAALG
jgi:predicted N-acetyltransferase YhbS